MGSRLRFGLITSAVEKVDIWHNPAALATGQSVRLLGCGQHFVPLTALGLTKGRPRWLWRLVAVCGTRRRRGIQALENVLSGHVCLGGFEEERVRGRQPDGRSRGTDPPARGRPGPTPRAGNRRSRENCSVIHSAWTKLSGSSFGAWEAVSFCVAGPRGSRSLRFRCTSLGSRSRSRCGPLASGASAHTAENGEPPD
jgi:hypothetical protein